MVDGCREEERRIGLQEELHTGPVAERRIDLVEEHRTVLVVEERHTGLGEEHLAEARRIAEAAVDNLVAGVGMESQLEEDMVADTLPGEEVDSIGPEQAEAGHMAVGRTAEEEVADNRLEEEFHNPAEEVHILLGVDIVGSRLAGAGLEVVGLVEEVL